ncbi:MAG: sigma-70 family RNA polymerase sigma factor [Spirochaetaceae bacterium]|nr:sigma-70 family RNA polymerase sigma factor [Spirochaetaceae bacterium]
MTMKKTKNEDSDLTLHAYLDEISRYSLLNYEQELDYSHRIEDGDHDALNALINANLRLVVKIAKAYVSPEMGLMDLIQEGNLGLIKAAEKYDYRKEVRFSTYASWWIKQSISRSITNKRRAIRLPHRKEESLKRLQKISEEFSQEYYRQPNVEELAAYSGMNQQDVVSVLDLGAMTVSLDSEINMNSGTLLDVLEDNSYSPDHELVNKSLKEDTRRFLNILREREKTILMYRFAFDEDKKYTLKMIGEKMGISPETVRQIEMRALKKLRTEAAPIREYFYN